jgi:hypothetical protein
VKGKRAKREIAIILIGLYKSIRLPFYKKKEGGIDEKNISYLPFIGFFYSWNLRREQKPCEDYLWRGASPFNGGM